VNRGLPAGLDGVITQMPLSRTSTGTTAAGSGLRLRLASWVAMNTLSSTRFPVTITRLPVVRCQICHQTVAHKPGRASAVLTDHYRRVHPDILTTAGSAG